MLNTLILLTSGTTVTWAHHALLTGDRKGLKWGLGLTIALGVLFTAVQAYEYIHAPFAFSGSIYGATFFMATGFHGFHVIMGTIFLAVCLLRALIGQLSLDHHLGFEFAAWYWHFVDVVWLFLFSCIYVWGTWAPPSSIEPAATGAIRAASAALFFGRFQADRGICAQRGWRFSRRRSRIERDEKKCEHFFARIPLQTIGIDHVHDFGSIRSKIIVI